MASPKETLVKLAADYYMWVHHHGPIRQDNLFRTYLWLATLVLAVAGALFDHANPVALSSPLFFLLLVTSATASLSVLYCLHHMRGRGDVGHPRLDEYCKLLNGEDDETRLSWMIEQYWDATRPGKAENMRRTRSLRLTTWLVSISFAFLVASGAVCALEANHPPKSSPGGDIHMSEEKPATAEREQTQPAPEQPAKPTLDTENALNRNEGLKPETGTRKDTP